MIFKVPRTGLRPKWDNRRGFCMLVAIARILAKIILKPIKETSKG